MYYKRVNSHILYPILLYATPPDCHKVENWYKTENPIGITVVTFTAHSKIVILQFYKDCSIIYVLLKRFVMKNACL